MVASYPAPANNNTFQANAQLDDWLVTAATGKGSGRGRSSRERCVCVCGGGEQEESVIEERMCLGLCVFVCASVFSQQKKYDLFIECV